MIKFNGEKKMNLYKISKETGTWLSELAKADLAYLAVTCSLGPTILLDIVEYSTAKPEEPFRRTMNLLEGTLKFIGNKKS